jgi:hypothetical protein
MVTSACRRCWRQCSDLVQEDPGKDTAANNPVPADDITRPLDRNVGDQDFKLLSPLARKQQVFTRPGEQGIQDAIVENGSLVKHVGVIQPTSTLPFR